MLLKGAIADGAAAGIAHLALTAAAQQRAPQIIAGAHALRILIGNMEAVYRPGIHRHAARLGLVIHLGPQQVQHIVNHMDIFNIGQVFHHAGLITQKHRGNDGHGGIFAPKHCSFSPQRRTARNQQLVAIHAHSPSQKMIENS